MFKFIRKIMISIINAIKSLFVGDKEVISVSIGDTQVYPIDDGLWPTVPSGERWRIEALNLQYSSGTKLDAAGSNYAEIVATVYKYRDNMTTVYEMTTMSCPLETDTSWIELRNGDTRAYGENRGTQNPTSTGAERTGTLRAIGPTSSGYLVNVQFGQNFTVTQQTNSRSVYPGTLNLFTVGGVDAEYGDPNNTSSQTLSLFEDSQTLFYTISGVGGWIYASGAISQATRSPEWVVSGVDSNNNSLTWISSSHESGDYTNGTVTIDQLPSGTRSGYIKAYDPQCSEVYLRIPITQSINSRTLAFYRGSGTVAIDSDSTSFNIDVVPKDGGTLISNTNELGVQILSSTIGNLSIGTKTLYSNYVRVSFSCDANISTTSNKTATIVFSYGGKSITATVTQEKYHPIPSFFSQAVQADNNPSWWIGTPNINGTSKGIFMYCENSITEDTEVEINIDWIGTKGGTTYNCEEEGNLQIIPQTSEQNVGGYSKTGYWLISKDGTAYDQEIDTTFTITDFTVYSFTIRN